MVAPAAYLSETCRQMRRGVGGLAVGAVGA